MKTTVICLTMSFCLLSGFSLAHCEEPVEQYMQGLKDRGYFDIALEYLEEAAANGTIAPELRERLDFERGAILLDGLPFVRDGNQRQANLERAEQLLEEFIRDHPRHPHASFAQRLLGDLFVGRARLAMANSNSKELDKGKSKQLVEQAREFYQRALDAVNDSRAGLKELLIALDPAIADPATKELARKYQDEYLRVRLIIGMITEELAGTCPKNSMAWGMYLEQAIDVYDDYAKDYRSKPIASRARLYQARCHDQLGNEKESMKYINEVLDQPDAPVFYDVKRDACLLGVKTWFAAKPPQYLLAIQEMDPLVSSISTNKLREAEWLALQFWLAKAYHGFAEEVVNKAEKSPEDIKLQSIAEKRSRELILHVARYPNEFKQEAQDLLAGLKVGH